MLACTLCIPCYVRLDQDLGAQRDLVTKTKHERDEHRLGVTWGDQGSRWERYGVWRLAFQI